MELAQQAIKESMDDAGTWTYGFLSSIHSQTKRLRSKDYDIFVTELFKFIMNDSTQNLQKFKIAQMLSSLKFQNPTASADAFPKHKDEISKFVSTLDSTPLAQATKKLLMSMFAPQEQYPGTKKYKAFSVSPVVFTTNLTKAPRRNTYHND